MCARKADRSSSDSSTTAQISIVSLKFARFEIGIHWSGMRREAISGLMTSKSSAPYEKQKIASRIVVLPLSFSPMSVVTGPESSRVICSMPLKFLNLNWV
jgi:hypothetical protein